MTYMFMMTVWKFLTEDVAALDSELQRLWKGTVLILLKNLVLQRKLQSSISEYVCAVCYMSEVKNSLF